jgi:hypothetical protein
MELWEYTVEELIGGAEIRSDMILAPEIEMPWESDKIERIMSMPNYATGLADQVLLERDGDGWKCVGHYVDDTIIVFRPKHWPGGHLVPSLCGTSQQDAYHDCS